MKPSILLPLRRLWSADGGAAAVAADELTLRTVDKALDLGASLVGVADGAALRAALAGRLGPIRWLPQAPSAVVLAKAHPADEPALDRWDGDWGGTPGNRLLRRTAAALVRWFKSRHGVVARAMPYQVRHGGIYVKEAAVLAGLGVIGRNNLVVTPSFGPRVRLRVVLVDAHLEPTDPPAEFAPCEECPVPCRAACPRGVFAGGGYDRRRCLLEMVCNEATPLPDAPGCIQYCRACELACPVGT